MSLKDLDFTDPPNSPKATQDFNILVANGRHNVLTIGFAKPIGDVNRFLARFRLAKEFKCIKFDKYQKDTANGYDPCLRCS